MSVPVLGSFPNTIGNLPDRPNLPPQGMKDALQQDLQTLWPYVQNLITEVNSSSAITTLPLAVTDGGTGATTKSDAMENLGVYVGSSAPTDVASNLAVGDIYIYVPDLPA